MSLAGRSSHSERFAIFDGNDYLYWKERMRIRIQAVNYALWPIVEDGYIIQQQNDLTSDDKAICSWMLKQKISSVVVYQKTFSFGSKGSIPQRKFGMSSTMLMKNLLQD